MWRVFVILGVLSLSSCATAPRVAPRFVQPSTAPIQRATAATKKHIESAKVIVREVEKECPDAAPQIVALNADLDGALNELQTSEGARVQLETQLSAQTQQANTLADNYDKAGAQITSLRESRHGWVKWFWYSAAANIALLAWIFKGPLLRLIGL